jgi:hypothetical protein
MFKHYKKAECGKCKRKVGFNTKTGKIAKHKPRKGTNTDTHNNKFVENIHCPGGGAMVKVVEE